jgi:hypothetical protein
MNHTGQPCTANDILAANRKGTTDLTVYLNLVFFVSKDLSVVTATKWEPGYPSRYTE